MSRCVLMLVSVKVGGQLGRVSAHATFIFSSSLHFDESGFGSPMLQMTNVKKKVDING